jgi:hypothetical protein
MAAPVTVQVQLYLNGAWTDVTSYVRQQAGIDITYGIQSEGAVADPSSCTIVVNNRDGRFSPRNTSGAYYPYLKRATPLWVKVNGVTRFVGRIPDFASRWNENGSNVYMTITAHGLMRRLAHASSLDSTLTTTIRQFAASWGVTGYWPVEDATGATTIYNAYGGSVGTITAAPTFAAVDLGVGSHDVATWGGASATFEPTAASSTAFTAGCYIQLPTSGLTGGEELFSVEVLGTAQFWKVLYSPGSGGSVFLQVLDQTRTEILATANNPVGDGSTFYCKLECSNSGSDVAYAFSTLDAGGTISGTLVGATVGAPTRASIGAGTIAIPAGAAVAIGHVVLGSNATTLLHADFDSARAGFAGETVPTRLARLATANGINIGVTSGIYTPTELGPQPDGTLLDVLRATEKADAGGILRDSIDTTDQLIYITRVARYNDQQSQTALDYSLKHLVPPLEPDDDDATLTNEVKVNRDGGSSASIQLTTGALSNAAYPAGVGSYPFEDTYAVYDDEQLPYLASWLLRLGTIDETRFPAVTVDLIANTSKVSNIEALRPGHRLRITNLPAYAGAASVDLQVVGWHEHVEPYKRYITLVCEPGSPWFVFRLNSATYGVLDQNYLAY